MTARGPIAFGAPEASGLPAPPQALRLGGAREESAPPDGALVVGGTGPFTAQVLSEAPGAAGFAGAPSSLATVLPSDCGFTPDPTGGPGGASGSLAPTTSGGSGAGSVGSCWFRMSASAPLLTTRLPIGIGWDGLAFDADWGRGNHVAFGSLDKLTSLDADGIPVRAAFGVVATGGTDPGSAGAATNGIRGAVVEDTSHGPAGPSQLAVAAGPAFASTDGGATMRRVIGPGFWQAVSSQWWNGTSGDWLVFGYSLSCDNMLSAQRDGSGAVVLSRPNVGGASCADLGGPATADCAPCAYMPLSLAAIPGTDSVFIGLGTRYTDATGRRHLYRARLAPGDPPVLADRFSFDPVLAGVPLYQPRAMAYCPASAADPRMRDVLFVASGVDAAPSVGSLVRITGASTGSPVATQVGSVPHDVARTSLQDVRADCATGVVYAGGSAEHTVRSMAQTAGLYRSGDAGLTFARVTLPEPSSELQIEEVTAIGLNPADAQDVTVATTFSGTVLHSTDGGASWTTVNDPAVSRPARVSDIEFTPTPAATGSALLDARRQGDPRDVFGRPFATAARDALVGTSNGAFRADLTTGQGVMAIAGTTRGVPGAGVRISALRSDGDPAVVSAAGSAPSVAVFRRADGLYLSEATEGSWWNPTRIPGTRAGDGAPAVARDRSGRLLVGFARARGTRGVHLVTRSARGAWSKPRRLGALAGDTLPAIAVPGRTIHVVFLRTRGGARGVYDAVFVNRRWRRAARIPGTTGADALAKLGGPAAQGAGGTAHLTFARAGSDPGVLYAVARGSRWSAPRRLTTVRGDVRPALAVNARRVHIVFRRPGRGGGLFALSGGGTRWVARRVPGSTPADTDPAINLSGRDLLLAFARRHGARPGIYVGRAAASGRWVGRPRRWSRSPSDAHPALGSAAGTRLSVVFERR